MTLLERFESVNTIKELFVLREELRKEEEVFSNQFRETTNMLSLDNIQDIRFYIKRIDAILVFTETKGIFLNNSFNDKT